MDTITLNNLQKTEYAILCVIDDFCHEHGISYSLYGGTLIGAVRHQGYIPWDDDIDIVMTRDQYTEFCDEWKKNPISGYYLENYETDSFTQNTHTKIRKNNTILLSDVEDESIGHHGIWIDIFVMDKVSKNPVEEKKVIDAGRKMILMAKANGNLPGESLKKRAARNLLKVIYPKKRRTRELIQIADFLRQNEREINDNYERCDMCTLEYLNVRFPEDTGEKYTRLQFEERLFPVFSNYDEVLKIMYGNYMSLPPVEEQVCKHNPKIIQF